MSYFLNKKELIKKYLTTDEIADLRKFYQAINLSRSVILTAQFIKFARIQKVYT